MLTREDLQAIAALIDDRLDNKLEPIKQDISVLKADVSNMKQDVSVLKADVEEVKEQVEITRGATEEMLKWFDKYQRYDFDKKFPVDSEVF